MSISRASDTLFVIAGMVGGMRSDYPEEWEPGDYEHAMSNGWKHFDDEPDFMYLDTPMGVHGMSFGGDMGTWHTLYNPEGISRAQRYGSPREVVDEVARRQQSGQGWSDYPRYAYQQNLVNQLSAARESGDQKAEEAARRNLAYEKASEEAISRGGSNLYNNLGDVHKERSLGVYSPEFKDRFSVEND